MSSGPILIWFKLTVVDHIIYNRYQQHLEECKKLGDRSKCCRTNLAKMLPYALDRMSSSGTEAFQQPVTTEVAPNYFDFVHYPMDMGTLRQVGGNDEKKKNLSQVQS